MGRVRSHLASRQRRRLPQARDLSERITINQVEYDSDGTPTGSYSTRKSNVPARLFRDTGDQIFQEETLRLENVRSFHIRHMELGTTDRVLWGDRDLEIQAIIDLVPRQWLQLDCRESE